MKRRTRRRHQSLELLRRLNAMRIVGGHEDHHTVSVDLELDQHDMESGYLRTIERNGAEVRRSRKPDR